MHAHLPYYLAFSRFPKFGAKSITHIREHFGDLETAWRANGNDLIQTGLRRTLISEFIAIRPQISPQRELELLSEHDLYGITIEDDEYPSNLKEIHSPPAMLIVRGELPKRNEVLLSVVGSRRVTPYGERTIGRLIPELVHAGVSIVSGLALGCDGLAHHNTVQSDGKTYGVLAGGCDWDNVSPGQHRQLARSMIASGGGLLSEFPIGTHSLKGHFPFRNRIVSGLSKATLIIEAAEKSGSLITARLAMEQNRDVLAIPGPIDSPQSTGTNRLIRQGAFPITCTKDILDILNVEATPKVTKIIEPENADEAAVIPHLTNNPRHVDELVVLSRLPATLVLQTLTALELRDVVSHTGGNQYSLR